MAARDHTSRDQFAAHLAHFDNVARKEGWDTCEGAAGMCEIAAGDFADAAGGTVADFSHPTFPLHRAYSGWQGKDPSEVAHSVAVVNGQVVDWTARQFDPDADFPHVEDLETYRKRWHRSHGE